jgi:hypothetical protein
VPYYSAPLLALVRRQGSLSSRVAVSLPLLRSATRNWWLGNADLRGCTPLRLWKPGALETLLSDAGLVPTRRDCRAFPLVYASFEAYWESFIQANPASLDLGDTPEGIVADLRTELRDQFVSPRTGEVLIWNEAALVLAAKPA